MTSESLSGIWGKHNIALSPSAYKGFYLNRPRYLTKVGTGAMNDNFLPGHKWDYHLLLGNVPERVAMPYPEGEGSGTCRVRVYVCFSIPLNPGQRGKSASFNLGGLPVLVL